MKALVNKASVNRELQKVSYLKFHCNLLEAFRVTLKALLGSSGYVESKQPRRCEGIVRLVSHQNYHTIDFVPNCQVSFLRYSIL